MQKIQEEFWFPRMRNYVKAYLVACVECCYNKSKTGKPEGELYIEDDAPIPFRTLNIDQLGPFPKSRNGNTHVVYISDPFSKYLIIKAVRNT